MSCPCNSISIETCPPYANVNSVQHLFEEAVCSECFGTVAPGTPTGDFIADAFGGILNPCCDIAFVSDEAGNVWIKERNSTTWRPIASTSDVVYAHNVRLSGVNGDPVADFTGANTIYLEPYNGNNITLFYSGIWQNFSIASGTVSLVTTSLPTANRIYDIFAYWDGASVQLEAEIWSGSGSFSDARNIVLTSINGFQYKSTDQTRLYVGTIRIDGSKLVSSDETNRELWNRFNRLSRGLNYKVTTPTWTSIVGTGWRGYNGASVSSYPKYIVGLKDLDHIHVTSTLGVQGGSSYGATGISINSVANNEAQIVVGAGGTTPTLSSASYSGPAKRDGLNYIVGLERANTPTAPGYASTYGLADLNSGINAIVYC